jgi:hypothetical protein
MNKNSLKNLRSKSRGAIAPAEDNKGVGMSRKNSFYNDNARRNELSHIVEQKKESEDKKREIKNSNQCLKSLNTSQER